MEEDEKEIIPQVAFGLKGQFNLQWKIYIFSRLPGVPLFHLDGVSWELDISYREVCLLSNIVELNLVKFFVSLPISLHLLMGRRLAS